MQPIIYINEKNGSRELQIPWTPEKIRFLSHGARFASYDLLARGEVKIPSGSNLHGYSWDGILPGAARKEQGILIHKFEEPKRIQGLWSRWRESGTLLHLLIPGTPINHDVYLEDYDVHYAGAFGDYEYSISFIDAREITVTVTAAPAPVSETKTAPDSTQTAAVSSNTYRVTAGIGLNVRKGFSSNSSKLGALEYGTTVTVLSMEGNWAKINYNGSEAYVYAKYLDKISTGTANTAGVQRPETQSATTSCTTTDSDTLWGIATRFLGDGTRWTEIYDLNQSLIESTAQAHGRRSSDHGHWIWGGMKLQIRK